MRISIFGLGYVGCVCAARLAEAGHRVVGVDINEDKVATVNAGTSPIVEPGLEALLAAMVAYGRLSATTSGAEAVAASDVALICVGTPGRRNGQLDTGALEQVCQEIGHALQDRNGYTVVVRSTVLPGTTEGLVIPALRSGMRHRFRDGLKVAVNPEFIREGSALQDFLHPPFTLVGSEDMAAAACLREIYTGVEASFVHTDVKTAEMIKYVANSFHALKVCFANEIGDACEGFGIDPQEVMRIFRMDHKLNVSEAYLKPGFAFGGSCLPKDIRALGYAARSADIDLPLIGTILHSNEARVRRAVDAVLSMQRKRIGVIGLSFKSGTDDLRESPMVTLVETLIGKGCDVRILDHNVSIARLTGANRRYINEEIPHIASLMCADAAQLLAHAELLVVGNGGAETERALRLAPADLAIVDLTRGATLAARAAVSAEENPCPSRPSGAYTSLSSHPVLPVRS